MSASEAVVAPPHSIESEHAVLGGLLIDNSAWDRAGDMLNDADFYRYEHKQIYAAIGKLINAGKPADVVTVFEELTSLGKAHDCGGLAYLNDLAQSVPSAANLRRYAETVRKHALSRLLIQTAREAVDIASSNDDFEVKVDKIGTMFSGLQQTGQRSKPVSAEAVAVECIDRINSLAEGIDQARIPTHIAPLNEALNGGAAEGAFIVIAARPGVGKSSFAEELLLHAARLGHAGLFLSQEMSRREIGERALANIGRIDYGGLQRGQLSDDQWGRLSEAVDQFARLPLHVDDQAALTLHEIRAKAMSMRRQGLKVLVLDYLQLCAGSAGKDANRNAEIEQISRGLKALAKDLGIVVIALSQLNRQVEQRTSKRPQMSDLRDSGAVEQDADAILFLWQARDFGNGTKLIGLHVAKNRQGRTAEIALHFDGAHQHWAQSTESLDPPTERSSRARFDE